MTKNQIIVGKRKGDNQGILYDFEKKRFYIINAGNGPRFRVLLFSILIGNGVLSFISVFLNYLTRMPNIAIAIVLGIFSMCLSTLVGFIMFKNASHSALNQAMLMPVSECDIDNLMQQSKKWLRLIAYIMIGSLICFFVSALLFALFLQLAPLILAGASWLLVVLLAHIITPKRRVRLFRLYKRGELLLSTKSSPVPHPTSGTQQLR